MLYQVTDWDDAYANGIHIPRGDDFPARWEAEASAFRATARRQDLGRGDLFLPEGTAKGLAIFIHGGFWMRTSPATWSHLAAGPLVQGWAVAMPGYTLAPKARISQMTREAAEAISLAAERVPGPLTITGHSAGGHLAARMICDDGTLPNAVAARIRCCLPISPLSDLRPMMRTAMNDTLAIDDTEAATESPALLTPRSGIPITTWVGAAERPEFIRQARLLADIWAGLGAATDCVIEPGLHHFDIIDGLTRPDSPLTRTLLA
ncbi:alpha/beta hydrolase [Paracoccus methylarcula]|uniref:Alpha/beta hydrolase n=1 Tax=Paracoccus methylarcula TaxID=72022 RepID=A0A422QYV3_9RHOB|nr:alpha/beta hydrolase [Paracoccus methylarcula]RNF35164.1 alpha/beta hydrolase [Paracoccus methylarcula]